MTARRTLTVRVLARVLLIGAVVAGAAAARAENEVAAGQAEFKKVCAPCHSPAPGKPAQGPDLHGVMGRKAGSVTGFAYSDAMKDANFTWTPEKMDQWLTSPHEAMPHTAMMFTGIPDPKERAAVIKFLEQYKAK
jgi:cytochrome c